MLFWIYFSGNLIQGSTLTIANQSQTSRSLVMARRFLLASLASKQNEIGRTSFFLLQGRQTQTLFLRNRVRMSLCTYHVTGHVLLSTYANLGLSTSRCVVHKQANEHVIMLKQILDKQDSLFRKHTSTFFFVTKWVEQNKSFLKKSRAK